MQVNSNIKAAYGIKSQHSVREGHRTAAVIRDREILDSVSISGKKKAEKGARGGGAVSIDKVDLSTKLTVDDVNRLLEKEVGRKVKEMFDAAGIDPVAIADTDWSPEATAERIFRGTTGLFGAWKAQHKDISEAELINGFEKVLRASVDQGAAEAIGIIQGRKFDSENDIVATAEETVKLVHEKFNTYFESLREKLSDSDEEKVSETAVSTG